MLHGEDSLEIFKPMKADGSSYRCVNKYLDFMDKGKLTVSVGEKLFYHTGTGELHARIETHSVLRGVGGYGFKGGSETTVPDKKPNRAPDFTVEEKLLPS